MLWSISIILVIFGLIAGVSALLLWFGVVLYTAIFWAALIVSIAIGTLLLLAGGAEEDE